MTSATSNHEAPRGVIVTVDESRPARIAIVDDHTMFAHLLVKSLTDSQRTVTAVFDGTEDDLATSIVAGEPDLVLLDLHLGAQYDPSIPLLSELVARGLGVVMVTASEDRLELAACLEAGAMGFVQKSASVDTLSDSIRDALCGRPLVSSTERMSLMVDLRFEREHQRRRLAPFSRLTKREAEVLQLLCDGHPAAEIAEQSFVSLATVRSQIRSILAKLGVSSQLAAVGMARQSGWNADH